MLILSVREFRDYGTKITLGSYGFLYSTSFFAERCRHVRECLSLSCLSRRGESGLTARQEQLRDALIRLIQSEHSTFIYQPGTVPIGTTRALIRNLLNQLEAGGFNRVRASDRQAPRGNEEEAVELLEVGPRNNFIPGLQPEAGTPEYHTARAC